MSDSKQHQLNFEMKTLSDALHSFFGSFTNDCQNLESHLVTAIAKATANPQLEHLNNLDVKFAVKILTQVNKFFQVPLTTLIVSAEKKSVKESAKWSQRMDQLTFADIFTLVYNFVSHRFQFLFS